MEDRILFKDETNTTDTRSVMFREFENLRVDGEKKVEPVPSTPSGLDTPSSVLNPYSIAIFDTCALMHCNDILETTIKKNVIAVLPYTVLGELGKHASTRSAKMLQMEANRVLRSIDMCEKDPLFFTEHWKASMAKLTGLDMSDHRHDKITKCAIRVHEHMILRLGNPKRTIWFVTNDYALQQKAAEWQLKALQVKDAELGPSITVVGAQKFMDEMKMMAAMTKTDRDYYMESGDLEKLRLCLRQPMQVTVEEKLSTLILKQDADRQKKKMPQLQFGIFVVDTTTPPPTPTWKRPKKVRKYVPEATKPLTPMGPFVGRKKMDRMMMHEYGWVPDEKKKDHKMMRESGW